MPRGAAPTAHAAQRETRPPSHTCAGVAAEWGGRDGAVWACQCPSPTALPTLRRQTASRWGAGPPGCLLAYGCLVHAGTTAVLLDCCCREHKGWGAVLTQAGCDHCPLASNPTRPSTPATFSIPFTPETGATCAKQRSALCCRRSRRSSGSCCWTLGWAGLSGESKPREERRRLHGGGACCGWLSIHPQGLLGPHRKPCCTPHSPAVQQDFIALQHYTARVGAGVGRGGTCAAPGRRALGHRRFFITGTFRSWTL